MSIGAGQPVWARPPLRGSLMKMRQPNIHKALDQSSCSPGTSKMQAHRLDTFSTTLEKSTSILSQQWPEGKSITDPINIAHPSKFSCCYCQSTSTFWIFQPFGYALHLRLRFGCFCNYAHKCRQQNFCMVNVVVVTWIMNDFSNSSCWFGRVWSLEIHRNHKNKQFLSDFEPFLLNINNAWIFVFIFTSCWIETM